jgi:hypothetical protein
MPLYTFLGHAVFNEIEVFVSEKEQVLSDKTVWRLQRWKINCGICRFAIAWLKQSVTIYSSVVNT